MDFYGLSEMLWKKWIEKSLEISTFIDNKFQMEFLPEPYLIFEGRKNPLYFLTTNPGGGWKDEGISRSPQISETIIEGKYGFNPSSAYSEIAEKLGEFYSEKSTGTGLSRIKGFIHLSKILDYDGVVQVESCPFHSGSLPGKDQLIKHYETDPLLKDYRSSLTAFLKDKPVICLSAVGSGKSISIESIKNSRWLSWQAGLIGFCSENAEIIPFSEKTGKISSAFIFNRNSSFIKGFILIMGSNGMPSFENTAKLLNYFK